MAEDGDGTTQPMPGGDSSGSEPEPAERRGLLRSPATPLILLAAVLALATGAFFFLKKGSGLPNGATAATTTGFAGQVLRPQTPAPPTTLPNYNGKRVSLSDFKGHVVFVTFLYAHCPNICPIIASHLGDALNRLGSRAKDVRVVAISVDPRGDTPSVVRRFLAERRLIGRMDYLLGSTNQLARTWQAWNVGSKLDAHNPSLVAHSALVYGIGADGKLITIYPGNFQPQQIVHDVPKLASL
jgi:protein SCO1/2